MNELENKFTLLQKEHEKLADDFKNLKAAFYKNNFIAEQIFTKKITCKGGVDLGGTATIAAPTGGTTQDDQARAAINLIRTALTGKGITK